MIDQCLSIIIPVFNEEQTVRKILDKINEVQLINKIKKEVIIIDDCSTDKTVQCIRSYIEEGSSLEIIFLEQKMNKGKGAAIHRGIKEAKGDLIIIQDADLEYDPREYNLLLEPVLDGLADTVLGSRFFGGRPHRVLFFWHSIGNKFLTFLSNMFTNLNLTDMETCYKLFRSEIIKSIHLEEPRFGFEPEVIAKVSRYPKIRIYEVGISYHGRTFKEGKKIGWKDGLRAIYCIFKYNIFFK